MVPVIQPNTLAHFPYCSSPKAKFPVSAGTAFLLECPTFNLPCSTGHGLSLKTKGGNYEFCTAEGNSSEFRAFGTAVEVQKDTKINLEASDIFMNMQ